MKRPFRVVEIAPPPGTGHAMPRREFLRLLGLATGGIAVAAAVPAGAALAPPVANPFPDGIKSGDPRPRRATVWTRVAASSADPVDVLWSVAEDAAMQNVVRGGTVQAVAEHGHAITVKVQGLEPDRWYHYRFETGGTASVTGRLRTAPGEASSPARLRYAFASCQQRTKSYYVAHRAIAEEGVDFLLHLGDYVYVSDGGTITLDDYRSVWRTFHSNQLLQDMHAQVPLVAVWDDGEFYNGVDRTGDQDRLAAARQAWFEAMPVPANAEDRIHRSLRWGTLAEMFVLDTRQYRDPAIPSNSSFAGIIDAKDTLLPPCDQMFAPGRTTLGQAQRTWLKKGLAARAATWPIIASSYDMSPWKFEDRDTPELRAQNPNLQRNGGLYVSNEAWDDYQWERRRLMKFIARRDVRNVLVSSAHTHFYRAS
ncbi:MAG: alkaline phosphatase D family protein, partial [Alphaproteobacteria bacterium]